MRKTSLLIFCISAFITYLAIFKIIKRQTPQHSIQPLIHINHLGVIMDGNRRWAKQQGQPPWFGHKAGIEAVKKTIQFCCDHDIKYMTAYLFAIDNFKRSQQEVDHIFDLFCKSAQQLSDEFNKQQVRIRFAGDKNRLPEKIQKIWDTIEFETAQHNKVVVTFLFSYGGNEEYACALKTIAQKIANHELQSADITTTTLKEHSWTSYLPNVDLLIRTGNAPRLSNFLPQHTGYCQCYFTKIMWPDINEQELEKALQFYANCKNNYGT